MSNKIKSASNQVTTPLDCGHNPMAYEYIINDKMSVLRARLLNLADSITGNDSQRTAIKGLMKDFCNDAYYPLLREMRVYLTNLKILDPGSGCSQSMPLNSQVLKD